MPVVTGDSRKAEYAVPIRFPYEIYLLPYAFTFKLNTKKALYSSL